MKRIYLALIVLVGISVSCTKNFEDWQKDEKHPVEVPGEMLFTNAQKAIADQTASTNVNVNNWRLFSQYWTEVTYTNEANYDIVNRSVPGNVYRIFYRDVLNDLKDSRRALTATDVTDNPEAKLDIITMLEVYSYARLVDIFGMVPFSEALDVENIYPSYDDGMSIYTELFSKLSAAITDLEGRDASFVNGEDLYYDGDVTAWVKFGYTLQARMAITLADVYSDAPAKFNAAAEKAFSSNADDATLVYLGSPLDNTNPLYQSLVASGRDDFVGANTIVDMMNDLADPRIAAYFQPIEDGSYLGGDYGYPSAFSNYSHVAVNLHDPTYPATLLSFVELEFYKAEAAARGWGGDAATHYANAITASFELWGVDGAADYITAVPYDAANWKKSIGEQAWLGNYPRGFEAWTTYRRLDYPAMNVAEAPETVDGVVPTRFTFPGTEQTLNADAYYAAAAAIVGGDKLESKVFWDVN